MSHHDADAQKRTELGGLLEILNADHYRGILDYAKPRNPRQGPGDSPVRGVVKHQDKRDAVSFVTLRLDYGGDSNFGFAKNARYLGENPRNIHHTEPDKIARGDLVDGQDFSTLLLRYNWRNPVLGAKLQIQRRVGDVAEHGARRGVLAGSSPAAKCVPYDVATNTHRV